MVEDGAVYISKTVNVYDLLDRDDEEELLRLVEAGQVRQYAASAFKSEFLVAARTRSGPATGDRDALAGHRS